MVITEEGIFKGLTMKEKQFCIRYAQHLNGARAAREAGYSENTDDEIAHHNLRKVHIKAVIKHLLEEAAMPPEEAVKRLTEMGRGTVSHFINVDGSLNLNDKKAIENFGLIKKIKQTRKAIVDGDEELSAQIISTEIELHDAKDAIKTLLEVQGKLIQKVQVLGAGDIEL